MATRARRFRVATFVLQAGTVQAIFLAGAARAEPRPVREARAVPGRGLEGDRYFLGTGTFTSWKGKSEGEALTLVEAEALEAVACEAGIDLAAGASRRNIVTHGIGLNDLVGKRFRVGEVECYGDRLCDPCRHLERLTEDGALRALANRGGLRADILEDGLIAVRDSVVEL
ncbi:MAG: sulfurase [Thermoleophilaceae bacterium]|nr:sulfurase [Thermoleophilaceae bacterium]